MRVISYFLCFFALSLLPCAARLGETIEECHQRYGEPKTRETEEAGRAKHEVFIVGDFRIDIFYLDQKAVDVRYTKRGERISLDEARIILGEKESSETQWKAPTVIRTQIPNEQAVLEFHTFTVWKRSDGASGTLDEGPDITELRLDIPGWELANSLIREARPTNATKGL